MEGSRSRRRRRCRRASTQNTTAARICRIRTPESLTQEEGSETETRAAAIHSAAREEISSPFRTMTLPRGILVRTVSTERAAWSRRCAVSVPLKTRLGRNTVARKPATSVRSRPSRDPPDRRAARALLVCEPYSTTSESSRRRDSRPEAESRINSPRPPFSVMRSRLSTIPPRYCSAAAVTSRSSMALEKEERARAASASSRIGSSKASRTG